MLRVVATDLNGEATLTEQYPPDTLDSHDGDAHLSALEDAFCQRSLDLVDVMHPRVTAGAEGGRRALGHTSRRSAPAYTETSPGQHDRRTGCLAEFLLVAVWKTDHPAEVVN